MKVERGGKGAGGAGGGSGARRSAPKDASAANFAAAITAAENVQKNRDLDDLFARIEEQAELLVKKRTDGELTRYRELVTEFMKRAIGESVEMVEVASVNFMHNSKVYLLARRIEEKLLEMAEKIHSGQGKALDVVAATSEIRGMLIDLRG